MRFFFYLGAVFLVLSFAAAAAEVIPRSLPDGVAGSVFVSAHELWYAAWPGSLVIAQIKVEALSPALWSSLIVSLLAFPAWFLFALPGGLLIWFCRPHREMTPEQLEDLKKQEETLFLFDKLAREAEEADDLPEGDEMAPDHGEFDGIDILDGDGGTTPLDGDGEMESYDIPYEDNKR